MTMAATIHLRAQAARWRTDPVTFIDEVLRNPEGGKPFVLYEQQKRFLREAFTLGPDGRLRCPEMVFSAPKKSGKTGIAGMIAIYVAVVMAGQYGEIYCLANDREQAGSRVFQSAARIIEASPLLRHIAKTTANRIEFRSTGTFIQAVASDYASFAGGNPTLCVFDELWAYTSDRARRLWDEALPSPVRKVSGRLVVTYAGFEGESNVLAELYARGLAGEEIAPRLYRSPGLLMYWTHEPCPLHDADPGWLEQSRRSLPANQYLRMIENRWVSAESAFIELGWWDACVNPALSPSLGEMRLPVWVGVDASIKHDSTAVVACAFDQHTNKTRLLWHRVFQPSPDAPLDFEATIERSLLELRDRFNVQAVWYDPYQMTAVAQRLTAQRVPMVEFPQTMPNLTEASQNLYDLVKGRNLQLYPDADMRIAVSRSVALEDSHWRGWRIAKEKAAHKIDVIVALAQAALGAAKFGPTTRPRDPEAEEAKRRYFRWLNANLYSR